MRKKIPSIPSITLIVLITASMCLAGVPDRFEQAESYEKQGQYEQAEQIYQQIVTDNPGTDDALKAQKNLVIVYINTNQEQSAVAEFEQLVNQFSSQEGITEAIFDIAKHCQTKGKEQDCYEFYAYNVDNFPNDYHTLRSQVEVAAHYLRVGDDQTIQAEFDELVSRFSNQEGITEGIFDLAQYCSNLGRDDKAVDFYRYFLDNWPDDKAALLAQAGLSISYEKLDDADAAEAAYDKLLVDLAQRQLTDKDIYWIAKRFNWARHNDRAAGIHRYNVEKFPGDKYALWSQVEVAYHHIRTGDEAGSDAAVEKFLSVFAGHPALPRDVYNIAKEYGKAGRNEKALELYQYVIDHRPTNEDIYARMSASMAYIGLSDDANAMSVTDGLISDFNKHTDLAGVIFHIGEQYYERAFRLAGEDLAEQSKSDFRNAAAVWQRIITDLPPSEPNTPQAHQSVGECYRSLGEYEKAIEYYQKLVDNFPDYEDAVSAQYLVGHMYRLLRNKGVIDDSEANTLIKDAFERVVQNYPDSTPANAARNWLKYNVKESEGGQK